MITDDQWNIFAKYVKPNSTVEFNQPLYIDATRTWSWCKKEGFLLENFPYSDENDRIIYDAIHVEDFGLNVLSDEGRLNTGYTEELRVQLCDSLEELHTPPYELRYWVKGEFLEFDEVLALHEVMA